MRGGQGEGERGRKGKEEKGMEGEKGEKFSMIADLQSLPNAIVRKFLKSFKPGAIISD